MGVKRLLKSCEGQSSVEAAVMLPSLLLVLALLLEPACMLYTKAVMRGAAAEGCRVALTAYQNDLRGCKEYVIRRLAAVPEVPLFHVGGKDDWEVQMKRSGKSVSVSIVGHVRPLPLMGVAMSAFGESDETGVVMRVEVRQKMRPDWLGGDYGAWQKIWG